MKMPENISHKIEPLIGQKNTLCRVAYDKSLFIGFGEIFTVGKFDVPHGTWEIGTYTGGWRFVKAGKALCGRYELDLTFTELNERVNSISLGYLNEVSNLNEFDVRFTFSCGTSVDFLTNMSNDDEESEEELVHIFTPDKEVLLYIVRLGWQIRPQ